MNLKKRSEVATENTWDLSDLYESDAKWEEDFAALAKMLEPLLKLQGVLSESLNNLIHCFEIEDQIDRAITKVYTYAHLKSDQDLGNADYQAMQDRIKSKYVEISSQLAWILPEILSIPDSTIMQYFNDPKLGVWKRLLENYMRRKAHTLSPEEERLLAMAAEPMSGASKTFSMLSNADLKFPDVKDDSGNKAPLTSGNFIRFLESKNRDVRKGAFEAMYDTYSGLGNTFASTLDSNVRKQVFYARARKHESALQASLFEDNVQQEVYDGLIAAVHAELPSFYKYVDVRKRALGVDSLDMYDMYVPLVKDLELEVPFEQAREWVVASVQPLGTDYAKIVEQAFDERWIDRYENEGKRSGAYSSGCYDSRPYVLMNYQNNLNSVFTLAHELGHSMHSYLSIKNQPHAYSQYKIFVAEVASTLNEGLLFHYLMNNSTDEQLKTYLVNHKCDEFKGTVYRQTMFAEFEKKIHDIVEQGGALTKETLSQAYHELNKLYYGDQVQADQRIQYEWARIPHFYYNFYVYKYATGLSAAEAFLKRIRSGHPGALEGYLGFLGSGCTKDPLDLLAIAGVDLRKPDVVQDGLSQFAEYVDELGKRI